MKKMKFIVLIINILVFTIFINCLLYYIKDYKLNKSLINSKKEYITLNNKIEEYTKLKDEIDIINNKSVSLNDKITSLKADIESKNNSITNYNNKINELNNKISIMTGVK